MTRTIAVVTPENVEVTYELAGFASRFLATLVDLVIQFFLILAASQAFSLASQARIGSILAGLISALGIVLAFLLLFGYATFFEMVWGGRTPGKRLFSLRVIRDGGYPIDMASSCLRNVLRFIDFGIVPLSLSSALVLCGLPGMFTIFFSRQYKRIGDYAAGTLVIVDSGSSPYGFRSHEMAPSPSVAAFMPLIRNLDRLDTADYQALRRFVTRRSELDLPAQAGLGARLGGDIAAKLEIPVPIAYQLQYADLLEAIERRYAEERGVL